MMAQRLWVCGFSLVARGWSTFDKPQTRRRVLHCGIRARLSRPRPGKPRERRQNLSQREKRRETDNQVDPRQLRRGGISCVVISLFFLTTFSDDNPLIRRMRAAVSPKAKGRGPVFPTFCCGRKAALYHLFSKIQLQAELDVARLIVAENVAVG